MGIVTEGKRPRDLPFSFSYCLLLDGTGRLSILLVVGLNATGLIAGMGGDGGDGGGGRVPGECIFEGVGEDELISVGVAVDEFAGVTEVPILKAELGGSTCHVPCRNGIDV